MHWWHNRAYPLSISNAGDLFPQSRRPFHDYVLPMEGVGNQARLQAEPNYYGNSSPADRNSRTGGICGHSSQRQDTRDRQGNLKAGSAIGFNNYAFSDMHETENHYVVPRVCVQNPHVSTEFFFWGFLKIQSVFLGIFGAEKVKNNFFFKWKKVKLKPSRFFKYRKFWRFNKLTINLPL